MPTLNDLEAYEVVSLEGQSLGGVTRLWVDEATGLLEVIGLRGPGEGDLAVPAAGAEIDENAGTIRVPFAAAAVRTAPEAPRERRFPPADEARLFRHFNLVYPPTPEEEARELALRAGPSLAKVRALAPRVQTEGLLEAHRRAEREAHPTEPRLRPFRSVREEE